MTGAPSEEQQNLICAMAWDRGARGDDLNLLDDPQWLADLRFFASVGPASVNGGG